LKSDGYIKISKGINNNPMAEVGLHVKNYEFAIAFRNILKEVWKGFNVNFSDREKGLYRVTLCSISVAEFLKEYNIEKIGNSKESIKCAFIRGVFDGDGFIYARKHANHYHSYLGLEITNVKIILFVNKLLNSIDIKSKFIKSKKQEGWKEIHRITITSKENILRFREIIGFNESKRKNTLNKVCQKYIENMK